MKILKSAFLILTLIIISSALLADDVIWLQQPASEWTVALPVGNGRLGGMVFGGITTDRIQLNEESLWTGNRNQFTDKPEAYKFLPEIRRLLFEGEYAKAQEITEAKFMGNNGWNMYQTLGDLTITTNNQSAVENYRRELNLRDAIAGVSYQAGKIKYEREYLSSHPDQVLVIRYSCDKPENLNLGIKLSRPKDATVVADSNEISMFGQVTAGGIDMAGVNPGVKYHAILKVRTDNGNVKNSGDSLIVSNATTVYIYIAAATNYWGDDPKMKSTSELEKALLKDYSALKNDHITDYRKYFDRVKLDLGGEDKSAISTDQRLEMVKTGEKDNKLIETYFNFGRYLLISSSRPGDLAENC